MTPSAIGILWVVLSVKEDFTVTDVVVTIAEISLGPEKKELKRRMMDLEEDLDNACNHRGRRH